MPRTTAVVIRDFPLADGHTRLVYSRPAHVHAVKRVSAAAHLNPEGVVSELRGRVAIVTGSTRGIGRAIALGLARSGCKVVVAGKSTESTEKLPGSVFTVATEIESLGAEALPVQVDVRDAEQIDSLVTRTLERFGRIDLLVNNAGALYWAGILDTPPKRFDLVMSVNARAAFLCCRAVLPTMIRQGGGHIVNMSPPMDLSILPGRVAYGISKLGMTLLTFGLAEEVRRHNVAVNSLWPVTVIESQASINHKLGTPEMWRKPDILVDCVLRLAAKDPGEVTGRALLDEDFLRAEGVTDFDQYACVPGSKPPRLTWVTPGTAHGSFGRPESSADRVCETRVG